MIDEIREDLERIYRNKPNRLNHIKGVIDTALELGRIYDLDLKKLEIAASLHDITKYYSEEENINIVKKEYDNATYILSNYNHKILHAFSAVHVAKEAYGITDSDILDSIMNHTIGRADMSMYEKVIFLSDYIEPSRTYESCLKVREIAKHNLDLAVYTAIDDSIQFYENEESNIPKESYEARTYYKNLLEEIL